MSTTIAPTFTPIVLPLPVYAPEAIASQMLGGGRASHPEFEPFGERAYFLVNMVVPPGHIQITPKQIILILIGERRRLRSFLHRLQSMKKPCKATLAPNPCAKESRSNYAYSVELDGLDVSTNPQVRDEIAITATFGIMGWISMAQVPRTNGEEEGGEWEELDPLRPQCTLLRDDNRREARTRSSSVSKKKDRQAWSSAISAVLDFCNRDSPPKSFAVAWTFVVDNEVLDMYATQRDLEVDAATTRSHMLNLCARLGKWKVRVVDVAIDGYERGLQQRKKVIDGPQD